MKLLEALALVDTTEGAVGVSSSTMREYEDETFYYKLDGVLYTGYNNVINLDEDEEVDITLALLEQDGFELVMATKPVITFTEEQFIAAWDNAVRRAVPTLGLFNNSNVGKATLNTLKQLYTVR